MIDPKERNADPKEKRKAAEKARRAEQAAIVQGLQTVLEGDEQLLGFARGRIAGGWRGKLAVGPEAFFAPFVNIALTERRFLLQHIQPLSGKPSDILPHAFPLAEIASLAFSDIETFGMEPAGRLVLQLRNEQYFRIRLHGRANVRSAKTMADLFRSLAEAHSERPASPTQRTCPACGQVLDRPYKFCPYCGHAQPEEAKEALAAPAGSGGPAETSPQAPEKPAAAPGDRAEETPDPADGGEAALPPEPPLAPESPAAEAPSPATAKTSAKPKKAAETPAERDTLTSEEAHQEQESETPGAAPLPDQSKATPTTPGEVTPPVERPADEGGSETERPQGGL
ncbi:MAG TPA: hypothetical protein VKT32_02515 [Chthonomonadaceae bacterium]|nr:hypothetical protein [Chthonomonadaceae bacterium]